MGALNLPGPQLGSATPPAPSTRGKTVQDPISTFPYWFPRFLLNELRPYPGRVSLVARIVLAATITMWLIMTFRVPNAAIAAFYTLLLSRDSPKATWQSAVQIVVAYSIGLAWCFFGIFVCIDFPLTHFLWVITSLFLCFYAIRAVSNYAAAAGLAFIITIVIPIWDVGGPTGLLVAATLWSAGGVLIGLAVTVLIEYLFSSFDTRDELLRGLHQRLVTVAAYLEDQVASHPDPATSRELDRLATVGVSRLRRLATVPGATRLGALRSASAISQAGRLVDLTSTLLHGHDHPLQHADGARMLALVERLRALADTLGPHAKSRSLQADADPGEANGDTPALLRELEQTTHLFALALSPESAEVVKDADLIQPPGPALLAEGAFSNPDNLAYALRGCLAASLCYIFINAASYRALSTSLATCVITGLSSIGASRQKQLLRISGAFVGGVVFGIGAQVLVLPSLDTIAGFTVLFVAVTTVAAWFATSSPRISYFGQQIALAFYLISLQEFYPQTNLAIARDRVLGIALGLAAMSLIFDTLGSKPAAQVMRQIFVANLRLLADFVQPWKVSERTADLRRIRTLRDKISANFGAVNAQADAVLFETGRRRSADLALRERLLAWQPRIRSLFSIQVGLLQYRTLIEPDELAAPIRDAQLRFDHATAATLQSFADVLSGEASEPAETPDLEAAHTELCQAADNVYDGHPTARAASVVALSRTLVHILETLRREIIA